MPEQWSPDPPTEEGSYWFYGEPFYGSMGGHFNGTIPPDKELHYVTVQKVSNGLIAATSGQLMRMVPFNPKIYREGYIGVWQRVVFPDWPDRELINKIFEPYN